MARVIITPVKRKFTAGVFILAVIFVAAYIAANRGTQMNTAAPGSPGEMAGR